MSSSAKRALRILEAVGAADPPLGVTELARALALAPGTVFRGLDALTRAGLAARYQSSSRYVLGHAVERLRQSVLARFRIRDVALPYLYQLASVCGETTSLHVRLGWYSVRIASVPGPAEVTNVPLLGDICALGDNYAGQAILAFLSDAEKAAYKAWAAKHRCSRSGEERVLDAIRRRQFSLGEKLTNERMAVAFPIRTRDLAVASIAIDGPVLEQPPYANTHRSWEWREIVTHFEYIGHAQPQQFESPFAHLDPDSIVL